MATTRPYESPLRAEQVEHTHAKILDAAIDLVADSGPEALTIPLVAERAGASVRTVYRHYPTKEALLEAISEEMEKKFDSNFFDRGLEELPDVAPTVFHHFGENETLVRAALRTTGAGGSFGAARQKRMASVELALAPVLDGRSPEERSEIVAAIYNLHSVRNWLSYRDNSGLSSEAAGRVVSWIIRTLIADLQAGGRP
jgi:AcrR family transcriptional regulator